MTNVNEICEIDKENLLPILYSPDIRLFLYSTSVHPMNNNQVINYVENSNTRVFHIPLQHPLLNNNNVSKVLNLDSNYLVTVTDEQTNTSIAFYIVTDNKDLIESFKGVQNLL
jgi:hypothetical protein